MIKRVFPSPASETSETDLSKIHTSLSPHTPTCRIHEFIYFDLASLDFHEELRRAELAN
jgi:hypothetical protein